MQQRTPIDPAEVEIVIDQWLAGALESLDQLIDTDASVIDIRDRCIFLAGCLNGAFQMSGVPIDTTIVATHRFLEELDAHLLERLPQHGGIVWKTNALN